MTILKSNYWFDRTDKVLGRVAVNKWGKCAIEKKKTDTISLHKTWKFNVTYTKSHFKWQENKEITKSRYPYTFKKSLFVILYELLVLNCNSETNVKNVSISPNVMFDFCTEISWLGFYFTTFKFLSIFSCNVSILLYAVQ